MSDIGATRRPGDTAVARPQAQGATTSATATVANLPTGHAGVTVGTLIKALVVSQNARGIALLQTDNGSLTLQTVMLLRPGGEVVLQVQSTGTQTRVAILSIDGRAPSGNTAHDMPTARPHGIPSRAEEQPVPHGTRAAARTGESSSSGMTASRHDPLSSHAPPAPGASRSDPAMADRTPLVPGVLLPARVTAGGGMSVPVSGGAHPHLLVEGDMLTVRILGMGTDTKRLPPVPAGSVALQGTLVSGAQTGQSTSSPLPTSLALGEARIALAAQPSGPAGSPVVFQILEARAAADRASAAPLHRDFLRLGTDWSSLKNSIKLLAEPIAASNAGMAGSAPVEAIPRLGPGMASTVLFFMSALRGGDVRSWLGEAVADRLGRIAQGQAIGRLADDFASLARHAGDVGSPGWHSFVVPVDIGARLEQFRLYYRRLGRKEEDGREDDATHFMVEADLSRIGLLQIEGLVRPRRFDLTIHSATALGSVMESDIREIFLEALTLGDLAGTIRFDDTARAPFVPPEAYDPIPGPASTIVI